MVGVALSASGCMARLFAPEEPTPAQGLQVTAIDDGSEVRRSGGEQDLPEHDERTAGDLPRFQERPSVVPRSFRVADLPVGAMPAPLAEVDAPRRLPPLPAPRELRVQHHDGDEHDLHLGSSTRTLWRMRVATTESRSALGLRVRCGGQLDKVSPARIEMVHRHESGGATYVIVDAWFDGVSCRAAEVRRTSIDLAPVLGRLLYAFRQCAGDCALRQSVTVLGPALRAATGSSIGAPVQNAEAAGPFARVTLELTQGAASSITAEVDPAALRSWYGGTPPSWARGERPLLLGLDITQTGDEDEALGLAYVAPHR
jgi:hypothetical protein